MPEQKAAGHEVFDLHGFMRIVRAVLVGNEDHGHGNAGIADDGGIMTGAAGQATDIDATLSGDAADLVGERPVDAGRTSRERLVEFEPHAALGSDGFGLFDEKIMEALRRLEIEASHVGREAHFTRDHADGGGVRRAKNADRKDQVLALLEPCIPMLVHAGEQFGRGHHSVVAVLLVDGARVSGLAEAADHLVADVAADARDDADAMRFAAVERRPLLDVKFEEGGDLGEIDQGLAGRNGGDIIAAGGHAFAERRLARAVLERRVGGGELPREGERADIGLAEEAGFLASDDRHHVVAGRRKAGAAHPPRYGQSGYDAGEAVIVAAFGHAVGMAAGNDRGERAIAPGQAHPDVACGVLRDLHAELFADGAQVAYDGGFCVAVALSGYALSGLAHRANGFEDFGGEVGT